MKPINFNKLEEITQDEFYELPDGEGISMTNHYEHETGYFRKLKDIDYNKCLNKYLELLTK